jgi:hypothetical protein
MALVKYFDLLLNRIYKRELVLLYGEGSKIEVKSVIYSTNNKSYVIDLKLYLGDTTYDDMTDLYYDGLNYLIDESWKCSGIKKRISLIYTLDI